MTFVAMIQNNLCDICVSTCVKSLYFYSLVFFTISFIIVFIESRKIETCRHIQNESFHCNMAIALHDFAIVCRTSDRMRLSTIFELLLILLLVAFAAYGRVIGNKNKFKKRINSDEENKKKINLIEKLKKTNLHINIKLYQKYRQNASGITFRF